jgi:sugar transferase (PEP-CTERM/EpsH1 system associated)
MAERFKNPVEIFSLNKGNKRDYSLPFKIAKLIRKIKPDIVHTRNWAAIDGVVGARLAGVKFIIHGEHGREATDPAGANNLRKRVRKGLNPWITKFIAVSAELRNWLVYDVGINEQKVVQIINGVNAEKFKPSKNKNISKSKLGIAPDSFIIGTVGRLDPVKDHETLFKAFSYFSKKNENKEVILMVVGTGPQEEKLKTLSEKLNIQDKVIFSGDREDVYPLYQCMDVYVLPSIAEGISNTILEAMACGLPIVASNVGGNHELIDDGKTGFFFMAGDYKELAGRLSYYSGNNSLLIEHGSHGRIRAEKFFSLQMMVERYEKLYFSMFDGKYIKT